MNRGLRYQTLIEDFLSGKISAIDFESTFLEWFKSEPRGMHPETFFVLDRLFAKVDAFWSECLPTEEDDNIISEPSLRVEAALALEKLRTIVL
jgi:hypothetical protein